MCVLLFSCNVVRIAEKVMAWSSCNCESICKEIHDSWGQPAHLIQHLAGLTQLECRKTRETYVKIYGEDPAQLLLQSSESSSQGTGVSQRTYAALSMMMVNPHERDAIVAREAFEQNDTVNYKALIEIFTCRKSSHVLLIQAAYHAKYKRQLDQDIISIEPSHPYQRILMALSASHKALQADASQHIARCDAMRLYQAGEGKPGAVDEAVLLEILSKRSILQLRLTFSAYKHIFGHTYTAFSFRFSLTIFQSLKNEKSGEFEDALRVVVTCICNPPKYYAEPAKAMICSSDSEKRANEQVKQMNEQK
nr:annexin D8-like isoform X3 [Coffea arabica]